MTRACHCDSANHYLRMVAKDYILEVDHHSNWGRTQLKAGTHNVAVGVSRTRSAQLQIEGEELPEQRRRPEPTAS